MNWKTAEAITLKREHWGRVNGEDVMDETDTISIEELREDDYDQLSLAGVSEGTPVDKFLAMQGNTSYVSEL